LPSAQASLSPPFSYGPSHEIASITPFNPSAYRKRIALGLTDKQGRAGLVAWRRSRGGVGALGKAFYKGGFEPRMNKREAALILSLKYANTLPAHRHSLVFFFSCEVTGC